MSDDKKQKGTKEYVVIVDQLGRTETPDPSRPLDLRPYYVPRGETVSLTEDEAKDLMDVEKHGPYGAVAPAGSKLAAGLTSAPRAAVDPAQEHARISALHGDLGRGLTDPAGEPSDKTVSHQDASVAATRALARQAQATEKATQAAIDEEVAATGGSDDLDSMSVKDMKALAKERGVEGTSKMKADELRDALKGSGSSGESFSPQS